MNRRKKDEEKGIKGKWREKERREGIGKKVPICDYN